MLCEFPCDSLPSLLTRATNLKPTDSWREAVNFLTTFILQCLAKVYMKSWKTQNSIFCCLFLYQPHHLFIISHYIFDFLVLFCLPSLPAVPILALLMTVLQQLNGQLCSPSGLSEEPLTCATKLESLFWESKNILALFCFGEGTTDTITSPIHCCFNPWGVLWSWSLLCWDVIVASCGHLHIQSTKRMSLWWQSFCQPHS